MHRVVYLTTDAMPSYSDNAISKEKSFGARRHGSDIRGIMEQTPPDLVFYPRYQWFTGDGDRRETIALQTTD
jgi:hypothetical protein